MLNAHEWSISLSVHIRAREGVRRCWLPKPLWVQWRNLQDISAGSRTSVLRVIIHFLLWGFPADFRRILGLMPHLVSHVICRFQVARDSLVGTSDWLRGGRSGDWILVEARLSAPVPTSPAALPASCRMSFPEVKRPGPGVNHPPLLALTLS